MAGTTKKAAAASSRRRSASPETFAAEEREAMKERATEQRARSRTGAAADDEAAVLAKIDELPEPDRTVARRVHEVVRAASPSLTSRLWYGMPAYAKDGKVLCFFQSAQKFKTRYATLGFSDVAQLDDGSMWPSAYALTDLTPDVEAQIAALVRRAVG